MYGTGRKKRYIIQINPSSWTIISSGWVWNSEIIGQMWSIVCSSCCLVMGGDQLVRLLTMSRLISLGSVAWISHWMPSSSLLNLSLELAYNILLRVRAVSGDLHGEWSKHVAVAIFIHEQLVSKIKELGQQHILMISYHEKKKILLFWQFSTVVKSRS